MKKLLISAVLSFAMISAIAQPFAKVYGMEKPIPNLKASKAHQVEKTEMPTFHPVEITLDDLEHNHLYKAVLINGDGEIITEIFSCTKIEKRYLTKKASLIMTEGTTEYYLVE